MKHFLSIAETSLEDIRHVLDVSIQLKKELLDKGKNKPLLKRKTLAMIFEKPSLRTRVSFSVAMTQLGGNGLVLREDEVGLGKREAVKDVARVLGGMCDGIMARTFEHEKVIELAQYAGKPVINGLTDYSHPCQAMADVLTLIEHFGDVKGKTLAYLGDANNVTRSLAEICAKLEMKLVVCAPAEYQFSSADQARLQTENPDLSVSYTSDPIAAVSNADSVYTDTWTSMGQEAEKAQRIASFSRYQVNSELLVQAPRHAVVLHCLPAYRGLEITEEIVESEQSLLFPQAENRLHVQKGLVAILLGGI